MDEVQPMVEDQYNDPLSNWRRNQSSFPHALGVSISFGGDGLDMIPTRKNKKKKRRKMKPFTERLNEIFSIEEDASIVEDQYHPPTAALRKDESTFKDSVGPNKTFGGDLTHPKGKSKGKRKRKVAKPIEQRIDEAIKVAEQSHVDRAST